MEDREDNFDAKVVLLDEEGKEIEVEIIDELEYKGQYYYAFIPAEISLDDSYELIIMKQDGENDEEISLVTLDDEDEYNEMYQIFCERNEEDGFEDEENTEE